jgi:uncharacterized membrane protein
MLMGRVAGFTVLIFNAASALTVALPLLARKDSAHAEKLFMQDVKACSTASLQVHAAGGMMSATEVVFGIKIAVCTSAIRPTL